jgi:hypothetical protein
MARGKRVNLQDITDLKSKTQTKVEPQWWQYREDISALEDYPDAIEYEPDEGENLRKLRVRVTKAATALGVEVTHRETARGTLLVFRPPTEGTVRRGGRRKKGEESAVLDSTDQGAG